jgi:hypothetical protein
MFADQRTDIFSDTKTLIRQELQPIIKRLDKLEAKVERVKAMLEGDVNAAYEDIDKLKDELEILKIKVAKLEAIKH